MAVQTAALSAYKRKPLKDFDWTLAIIIAVMGTVELLIILWGMGRDLPTMSEEEVREFFARRFENITQVEEPPVEEEVPEIAEVADLPEAVVERQEEAREVLEQPEERQQENVQERQARRREDRASRQARSAELEQQVINNSGGIGLVLGEGGGASDLVDEDRVQAGEGIGLSGVGNLVRGSEAEGVRRLRTDAPSGGGSGGVDIGDAISAVDAGVAGGTVGDLVIGDVESYDRSGKFSAEAARSPNALRDKISGYTPGLKDCYEQQLRRSADLSGSVLARFTIAPDGTTKDISFSQSRWSDERTGSRVERCMQRKIQSWRFDPIDDSLGDFKMGQKFTFGS